VPLSIEGYSIAYILNGKIVMAKILLAFWPRPAKMAATAKAVFLVADNLADGPEVVRRVDVTP
jgi:hypothetical protein